jgi:hypothetical protein
VDKGEEDCSHLIISPDHDTWDAITSCDKVERGRRDRQEGCIGVGRYCVGEREVVRGRAAIVRMSAQTALTQNRIAGLCDDVL